MSANVDDPELVRYPFAYHGTVADNADPDGLHRVRIKIPGIIDPMSAWAFPLTAAGGSAQRGGHAVPAVGADVVVWFIGGDIERPVYAGGWWGTPTAGSEMPTILKDAGDQAHLVSCFELGSLLVVVDERDGQRMFGISDSKTGMGLVFDLEKQGIIVKGLSAILIQAMGVLKLEGSQVSINGRNVTNRGAGI